MLACIAGGIDGERAGERAKRQSREMPRRERVGFFFHGFAARFLVRFPIKPPATQAIYM